MSVMYDWSVQLIHYWLKVLSVAKADSVGSWLQPTWCRHSPWSFWPFSEVGQIFHGGYHVEFYSKHISRPFLLAS